MPFVLPDTSVLIELYRHPAAVALKERRKWSFRISAVVYSELRRGLNGPAEKRFVTALARSTPPIAPSATDWSNCGDVLAQLRRDRDFDARGMRAIQNDVLIALSARALGLPVLTTNRDDFTLISELVRGLKVLDFSSSATPL